MTYQKLARRAVKALLAITTVFHLGAGDVRGWGLVVPTDEDSNQYYQVLETTLYRFDCPDGEVPTGTNCIDRKKELGSYPKIRASIKAELEEKVSFYEDEILWLENDLKEKDAETIALREAIALSLKKKGDLDGAMVETGEQITQAAKNLTLIKEQLDIIDVALKQNPKGDELKRLLARQARYRTLKATWTAKKGELDEELAEQKKEGERLTLLIDVQNGKLSAHLQALKPESPELDDMKAYLAAYQAEKKLIPELDARVTDVGASELAEWNDLGAPELFARMLKHVDICKNGGTYQPQPKKPKQQKPNQQNQGQQNQGQQGQQNPGQQKPTQQNPGQQKPIPTQRPTLGK